MVGRYLAIIVAVMWAGLAPALEGVPPAFWFADGSPAEDGSYSFSSDMEGGWASSYSGGEAVRAMKADRYISVPLSVRYGFLRGWELYGVVPYFRGSSKQEFVNSAVAGTPETYRKTLSGGDFGDMATVVRWAFWEDDSRDSLVCLHLGGRFATGTNPWQYSQNNFLTGLNPPRLSFGDGAGGGVMAGLQYISGELFRRIDVMAGYIHNLPFRATAMEPFGSEITVTPPSVLAVRAAISDLISGSWWAGLDVDGFWSPAGSISASGYLGQSGGALEKMLDSYMNLVERSGGLWMGASTGVAMTTDTAVGIGFKVPVLATGEYRFWRADIRLTYAAAMPK